MALQTIIVQRVSAVELVEVLMQAYLECGVKIIDSIHDSTGYYVYGLVGIGDKFDAEKRIRAYMNKEE